MGRVFALVAFVASSLPQAVVADDCKPFENNMQRIIDRLDAAGIEYAMDPERGLGLPLSEEASAEFNALFESATARVSDDLIIQDRLHTSSAPPGTRARARFSSSAQELEAALRIYPLSWNAEWYLGKIYQKLGAHESSYAAFLRSFDIKPTQPDVAREAGLQALELDRAADAECLFLAAIAADSSDNGLYSNLALAHLLQGEVEAALEFANTGAEMDPNDKVSAAVRRLIQEVKAGHRSLPKSNADLR